MAFANSGKTLALGNGIGLIETIPVPHRIHFWDVPTGKIILKVELKGGMPYSLDVSPDGKSLAAVTADGGVSLRVFDLSYGAPIPKVVEPEGKTKESAKAKTDNQPAEPAWRKEFRDAYALKDGELVKRIPAPYPKCRADYLTDRFRAPAGGKSHDDYFTVLRWKGDWAPAELARHTVPVQPADGISVVQLLDRVADIPANRIVASELLKASTATGDFVVRADADPEKVIAQLQKILQNECALRASFQFENREEDVFILTGKYEPKPHEGRAKDEIEVYATHLIEREKAGGGVRDSFDNFLLGLEQHIGHRVITDKVEGLPKSVLWRFHVRSPALKDPTRGIDTLAEDKEPNAVIGNVADQTGLKVKVEKRKVRVLVVSPEKPKE
jgi:hypothetical protein